jgi:hypothetical protein
MVLLKICVLLQEVLHQIHDRCFCHIPVRKVKFFVEVDVVLKKQVGSSLRKVISLKILGNRFQVFEMVSVRQLNVFEQTTTSL